MDVEQSPYAADSLLGHLRGDIGDRRLLELGQADIRACLVTLDNPAYVRKDGIAVYVFELARALIHSGCEVWVIGFEKRVTGQDMLEIDGVKYLCLPDRGSDLMTRMVHFMRTVPTRLARLEAEEAIDVFHGHGGYAGPIAAAPLQSAARVVTVHTTMEEDIYTLRDLWMQKMYAKLARKVLLPPLPVLALWRRWYFSKMDGIICTSVHTAAEISKELDISEGRLEVIRGGANYEGLQTMRSELDVRHVSDNRLLWFGRIAPRKGLQFLLRAMPALLIRYPSLRLIIVGGGEYLAAMQREVGRLGLGGQVEFKGYLFGKELVREIVESTMVVIPSTYEGVPLAMLEAMALGKAVVASALPGVCEVIRHGETGLLAEPGNPKNFANQIGKLLEDPELRGTLGYRARDLIAKQYTYGHVASNVLKVYQRLRTRVSAEPT